MTSQKAVVSSQKPQKAVVSIQAIRKLLARKGPVQAVAYLANVKDSNLDKMLRWLDNCTDPLTAVTGRRHDETKQMVHAELAKRSYLLTENPEQRKLQMLGAARVRSIGKLIASDGRDRHVELAKYSERTLHEMKTFFDNGRASSCGLSVQVYDAIFQLLHDEMGKRKMKVDDIDSEHSALSSPSSSSATVIPFESKLPPDRPKIAYDKQTVHHAGEKRKAVTLDVAHIKRTRWGPRLQ